MSASLWDHSDEHSNHHGRHEHRHKPPHHDKSWSYSHKLDGQELGNGIAILDPDSIVRGKTISEWAENWTAWGVQAPKDSNPLTDETGEFASVDNNGRIFFIAGPFNPPPDTTVEREFDVPFGKTLMVPVITAFDTEGPGIPATLPDLDPNYKLEVDTVLQDWDAVSTLFASVDGDPVHDLRDYRIETDFFSMGPVKEASLLASLGVPAGTLTETTKAVGYWLMIDGLPKGEHTLDFGGSFGNGLVSAEPHTIAHITVV